MIDQWWSQQQRSFEALAGDEIRSWHGQEMAAREEPIRFAPTNEVPCLQFWWLRIVLAEAGELRVMTYQNDAEWGLTIGAEPDGSERGEVQDGIFRTRAVRELPTGQIRRSNVALSDRGNLDSVELDIGGRELLLIAGELEVLSEGGHILTRFDESVLAFVDLDMVDQLPWVPEPPTIRAAT